MAKAFVHAQLPRAGLGNKLLVWARATVFARRHGLPIHVSGWTEFKIGPYLRRERSKRFYYNYFNSQHNRGPLRDWATAIFSKSEYEPDLNAANLTADKDENIRFVFRSITSWNDYFEGLRGQEELIRREFSNLLQSRYRAWLHDEDRPAIGVHVRRGDFRIPEQGEVVGANCNTRTPISYYADAIQRVRGASDWTLPVTIFTDGSRADVAELLALPDVGIAAPNNDIIDLIRLSQSRVIIPSFASTFSYWASFISDGVVITNPAQTVPIRSPESGLLEYAITDDSSLDDDIIKKIAVAIRNN